MDRQPGTQSLRFRRQIDFSTLSMDYAENFVDHFTYQTRKILKKFLKENYNALVEQYGKDCPLVLDKGEDISMRLTSDTSSNGNSKLILWTVADIYIRPYNKWLESTAARQINNLSANLPEDEKLTAILEILKSEESWCN